MEDETMKRNLFYSPYKKALNTPTHVQQWAVSIVVVPLSSTHPTPRAASALSLVFEQAKLKLFAIGVHLHR